MNVSSKNRPKLPTVLAILLVIGAAAYFINYWRNNPNGRPRRELWFYNLKTHELFAASDHSLPPIDTDTGAETGVIALVYTCDGDPKATNRFIAYLKKYTPELKQQIRADMKRTHGQSALAFILDRNPDGVVVSLPDVEQWFPESSAAGQQIIETGKKKGGCINPTLCLP